MLDNFSLERSVEIDLNIVETLKTLMFLPSRGKKELFLEKQQYEFKYILHKETRNLEIKIIYYILEEQHRVFVTDFFPVLMNPNSIKHRS